MVSKKLKTILYIAALVFVLIAGVIIRGSIDEGATNKRITDLEKSITELSSINQQLTDTNKQLADDYRQIEQGLNGLAGTTQSADNAIRDALETSGRISKIIESLPN